LFDKYTEANLSKDLECEIVRIFDQTGVSGGGRIPTRKDAIRG